MIIAAGRPSMVRHAELLSCTPSPYRMAMALQIEPRTRAELHALPDDGCRHELIDGVHIVTPAPSYRHQIVHRRLDLALLPHIQAHALGQLLASAADLALGEDEVLQPDIFLVPNLSPAPQSWDDITSLLLVVEVISPSSARIDREHKRLRYQRAGVPHYWVVDPEQAQVEVWHPLATAAEVHRDMLVWPEPAGAPLTIDLASIFAP